MPKTVDTRGRLRVCNNPNPWGFWGLRTIVAYSHSSSQCLLVSAVFGMVTSLHPTSFLMIFILVVIYSKRLFLLFYEN